MKLKQRFFQTNPSSYSTTGILETHYRLDIDTNKNLRTPHSKSIIIPLRKILPITAIGTFMSAMDGSIVNISLVTIADALNTDIEGVRWVTIIYLLTISSLIGIGGSLGDNYGRKKIFQLGMLFFVFGSLMCAFFSNFGTSCVISCSSSNWSCRAHGKWFSIGNYVR